MPKKNGLGRGLGAIFGEEQVAAATEIRQSRKNSAASRREAKASSGTQDENVSRETFNLKLSLIEPNSGQPRKKFDEENMKELADSIREHGVIQPIIVRKSGKTYKIIVGERRWRAARMAGLKEIPAIVRDMSDKETAEIALIENIQREDLNSIEEARAYRSLIDDFGMTQEELAQRVAKSRTAITNSLRLLQLDDDILEFIISGELTAGHARAILSINGKRAQYKAAREIINDGLSVREAEKLAKRYNSRQEPREDHVRERDPYIEALANELTERIRFKVNIVQRSRKKGRIEIEYSSAEELEQITDSIMSIHSPGSEYR